jgi:cell wall assembly regulator SMI1
VVKEQIVADRFQDLAEVICQHTPAEWLDKGVSEVEIDECEQRLGVRLPDSYRWFLREFGIACFPDYIYGIHHGKLPGLKVEHHMREERHEVEPRMPPHLIPFSPDGWGNHYCLDTSSLADGECPVVFWSHEKGADQCPEQTHPSFLDWLEEKAHEEETT